MPGLMMNALTGAKKDPLLGENVFSASNTGVDPALRTIDATRESVAGQLDSLLAKESGLMTRARTGAAQTANARGLLNSSMAAGAGEEAAINTAFPIANADANIYGTASRDNQAAQNAALSQNAQSANTAALANSAAANQSSQITQQGEESRQTAAQSQQAENSLFTRQAAQQTAMQQLQLQGQITLQNLQTAAAKDLVNIEADYKTVMQTSATAGQIMSQAQVGINDIMKDPVMTITAKTALIQKIQDGLKAQMGVAGAIAGLDLSGLLTF